MICASEYGGDVLSTRVAFAVRSCPFLPVRRVDTPWLAAKTVFKRQRSSQQCLQSVLIAFEAKVADALGVHAISMLTVPSAAMKVGRGQYVTAFTSLRKGLHNLLKQLVLPAGLCFAAVSGMCFLDMTAPRQRALAQPCFWHSAG